MDLDPYKILNVPYNATIKEIKEQFKRIVLKVHPDRGGNPKSFQIVKQAFKYLYDYKMKELKQLEKEYKNFDKIEKERNELDNNMSNSYNRIQKINKIDPYAKNFDRKNFNRLYNQHRITDADDRGYKIDKSTSERLDASDIVKIHKNPKKMQIAIIEEPEPIEALNQNYKKLGLKNVDNFSKTHSSGQSFTDLQQAYMHRDNLEENMGNVRKESFLGKNTKDIMQRQIKSRSKISYKMAPEQLQKYKLKQEEEKALEEQRRYYFQQQQEKEYKNFRKLQNYIKL